MAKRVLRTKLCDMLGIEYPILSAGMGPTLQGESTGAPPCWPALLKVKRMITWEVWLSKYQA